eukprot:gene8328-biopygen23207
MQLPIQSMTAQQHSGFPQCTPYRREAAAASRLPQILAGLRCLALRAGVQHDINPVMHVRTHRSAFRMFDVPHPPAFNTLLTDTTHWVSDTRTGLILVMVGLPGRGKSFISKRLCRWLNWKGISAKIFNVGAYRRKVTQAAESQTEAYFDPS